MKAILSGAAIALAAFAVTACGANSSSGNNGGVGGNGFGGSSAIFNWEGGRGEMAASDLQDGTGPTAVSDATNDATTQFQGDAAYIQADVASMKADPPPEDTSDWDKAIASYSAAVSDLNSGNASAAVSDLNAGSAAIGTFGNTVDDPDLETS